MALLNNILLQFKTDFENVFDVESWVLKANKRRVEEAANFIARNTELIEFTTNIPREHLTCNSILIMYEHSLRCYQQCCKVLRVIPDPKFVDGPIIDDH